MHFAMSMEDEPRVLLFVDILGFAALTVKHQVRVEEFQHERFVTTSITETQSQFNRFDRILDKCVFDETLSGGIQAMLFSDCAFFVFTKTAQSEILAIRAARIAKSLMQNFIKNRVPVRMGIGKGTFYDIEYLTKTDVRSVILSKSRFMGTAVIHAHRAERCGGKGMRIFVDESSEEDLPHMGPNIALLEPLQHVKRELNYLYDSRPISKEATVEADDRALFENVARMTEHDMSDEVKRQYSETIDAMNRMRTSISRKPLNILASTHDSQEG